MSAPRRITILGSTGSIGTSALDVIAHANAGDEPVFEIEALAAGSDVDALAAQALAVKPRLAVIADETKLDQLRDRLQGTNIACAAGDAAVEDAAAQPVDRVLGAIVGVAGLGSTLAAVKAGNSVALANKESIVCAGRLILSEAARVGVDILPVDSEHNAIFQALQSRDSVERLTITASGGPFRHASLDDMRTATPAMAKAHPVWDMGPKNSIDSATLMNKALEFIEAVYLFDMPEDRIDVLVHPQSIVHGMVHYVDGSVVAQLGAPDMRTPIAHALMWPKRVETTVERLDLVEIGALDFEDIDRTRFSAVDLARDVCRAGGGAPTVLNSANEAAVSAFIAGECGFLDISSAVKDTLEDFFGGKFNENSDCASLEAVLALESEAQRVATQMIRRIAQKREEATV